MSKEEDKLRKARGKRDRAKEKGVKERISDETADLTRQNKEIKGNIRTELKGARLPKFCGSVFYFTDVANKRIYTKQINLDGTVSINLYELKTDQVTNSTQYVTK
jgi:hypothetical protein